MVARAGSGDDVSGVATGPLILCETSLWAFFLAVCMASVFGPVGIIGVALMDDNA